MSQIGQAVIGQVGELGMGSTYQLPLKALSAPKLEQICVCWQSRASRSEDSVSKG